MKAFRIKLTGDLIRKGFRYQAIKQATALNLSGFIQYLRTGNGIYIHIQGEEDNVLQFIDWCKSGSHGCTIESMGAELTNMGYFRGFLIATSSYEQGGGIFAALQAEENEFAGKDNQFTLHPLKAGIRWLRTAFY